MAMTSGWKREAVSDDPTNIRNWQRRSAKLTTSGRLEAHDPARLAEAGVMHVVNLALDDHEEALEDERAKLEEHSIAYTHIPVPFDAPTMDHAAQLRAAMESADGPIHIHCIMNYRVSAFLYLLDIEDGVPQEAAHARMAQIWDPLTSDHPMARPWKELLEAAR